MSNSLLNAITTTKKDSKSNSTKNPAFYNRELRQFEREMIGHENPIVREAAASNPHCSTGSLVAQLAVETDITVLRSLLLHPNIPVKYIVAFASSDAAGQFDDDHEVIDTLVTRING